ncbi:hypothetical protein [Flavobacterium sp. XS2P39]|uniref:hypothetical protein n=1 Tax=Flavobacterium sp. XS2P39 TaxID=3401725 RepID=UPI003AACF096
MNKVNGIVNGLKFVLKYGIYLMALVKIIEFAIETLTAIDGKETAKTQLNE